MDDASSPSPAELTSRTRRIRSGPVQSALELFAAIALIEISLWCFQGPNAGIGRYVALALLLLVIVRSLIRRHGDLSGVPEVRTTAARAWAESLALTLGFSLLLLASARLLHRDYEAFEFAYVLKPSMRTGTFVLNRAVGAFGQQVVLQWFLWPLCALLVAGRRAALACTAAIFGCVHLPNVTLTALSTCGCILWIVLYQRNARIAPLVASHVILSVLAYGALPDRLLLNMKVGADALAEMRSEASLCNGELDDLVRVFASPEYYAARAGNDARFVHSLYVDVLDRAPKPKERAVWLDQLQRKSRGQVAASLLTCLEARLIREGRLDLNTAFFVPRSELLNPARVARARDSRRF